MIKKQPTAIICLSSNKGGMEIDALKLAQKLSVHTQIILITKEKSFISKYYFENKNFDFSLKTISFKNNFSFNIIFKTRKILKQYKIKNVIFFGASELRSLYFSFLNFDINLIIRHGTTKSKPKKDLFHRLIYSKVNYHVSISKHLENNVKYIIPFGCNSQSKLIYPSINIKKPLHNKKDKLTLLHLGRIVEGKGQIDAIQACKILIENNIDFHFYIVGEIDNNYKKKFMNFYNNCNYKHKIELVGFTQEVTSYINKSDIFIFPSYGEGFGNAFIEAISNNIICLTYLNTSFIEFKNLGFYFKTCTTKNIKCLSKTLLKIVENINIEKENSSKNNTISQKYFSVNIEINKYLELLK